MKKILLLFFLFILSNTFSQTTITLDKVNGAFIVPCKVNGVPMNFIFDTGATDVTISLTEAKFLVKQGLLEKEDIKATVQYQVASGEIREGTKINLREIEINGLKLNNISATIVHEQNAPLLLGMSALSQLGKIEIKSNKLIINELSLLDKEYGYKEIKLGADISFFKDKNCEFYNLGDFFLCDYKEDNRLLNLFSIKFDAIYLYFTEDTKKLQRIELLKGYSGVNEYCKQAGTKSLNDLEELVVGYTKILGEKPQILDENVKHSFSYVWFGNKVALKCNSSFIKGKEENNVTSCLFNTKIEFILLD